MLVFRLIAALLLTLCIGAQAAGAASTINSLPPVPTFPFPDSGCPANSTQNVWISQGPNGGNDYRATLNQINPLFIGSTAPSCPYAYELWEDTSVSPAVLRQYVGGTWVPVNTGGNVTGASVSTANAPPGSADTTGKGVAG